MLCQPVYPEAFNIRGCPISWGCLCCISQIILLNFSCWVRWTITFSSYKLAIVCCSQQLGIADLWMTQTNQHSRTYTVETFKWLWLLDGLSSVDASVWVTQCRVVCWGLPHEHQGCQRARSEWKIMAMPQPCTPKLSSYFEKWFMADSAADELLLHSFLLRVKNITHLLLCQQVMSSSWIIRSPCSRILFVL